ncbi:MAG: hypothetical protein CSA50_01280 [Gammaproteobacteria bacterium]|nr:MAG: hypothetical protein CSA50_01280 [Gammaproteobacteria bacterium]
MKHPKNALKSRLLIAFFAFVSGALTTSLMQKKAPGPNHENHLFTLFEKNYTLGELPNELAIELEKHIDKTDARTRLLLDIAAYQALTDEIDNNHVKAQTFRDFLASPAATEAEINRFWELNKAYINKPFHAARSQISHHITRRKRQLNLANTVDTLLNAGELAFNPSLYRDSNHYRRPTRPIDQAEHENTQGKAN